MHTFFRSRQRRAIFFYLLLLVIFSACQSSKEVATYTKAASGNTAFSLKDVQTAQRVFGLEFTPAELESMYENLQGNLESYQEMRKNPLDNSIAPAMYFDPHPADFQIPNAPQQAIDWPIPVNVPIPFDRNEIAFFTIPQLASLIRSQKITSLELTQLYIKRLKKYGPKLKAVVTITEELALEQAKQADAEIASGRYRGPLHGIPYGTKDLMAAPGYKTTWGAGPYKDQVIDKTATVIAKLNEAGAILVAKLTSGELAYGDVWFGGRTLNPWDLEQGSRGSSAGSSSATAAGLVAFSLGSETWGSIVSPSTRCGVTGLRPTYGQVSRQGVMTLSWSLDKVGPICRSSLDCALVFDAIRGPDPQDRTLVDVPFNYKPDLDLSSLKVGYLAEAFEGDTTPWGENNRAALQVFKQLGMQLNPISLPDKIPYSGLISTIIRGESAAAFDELVISNQDDQLARQGSGSRANSLRQARFIPAAEYIQANRHRSILIEDMHQLFQEYDLLIFPTYGSDQSAISNMTGHPAISLPNGFDNAGRPTSIILMSGLYEEATILATAHQYQMATSFDEKHPPAFR